MTNNANIGTNEKLILGGANIEFEGKISSKEFINKFGEETFRYAIMTIYNSEGEECQIDVTDFVINHLREYEDQDDFNGEVIINTKE